MPLYTIRNVQVEFPYEAYDLQVVYMDRVIQALQEKKHALLESPTGTGKTLCLLCAALAWRETQMKKGKGMAEQAMPPIIYASRTHSQLCQAMKEIKKTKYKVKSAILGSRQQQCCNAALGKYQGTVRNHACLHLTRAKSCQWHTALDAEPLEQIRAYASKVMDLEDLHALAKKASGPCPFYLSRKLAEMSDIVFVPYNYLVDKRSRQSIATLFSWTDAVVIFDEAHNIEQVCSEAASFDLPISLLSNTVFELERTVHLCAKKDESEAEEGINTNQRSTKRPQATKSWSTLSTRSSTLINMIKSLEASLTKMQVPREGKSFPGDYIFKLLSDACMTDQNWKVLADALNDAAELLVESPGKNSGDTQRLASNLNGGSCSFLADALEKAFNAKESPSPGAPPYHKMYRVHIHDDKTASGISRLVLSYWCFSPGMAMRQFISEQHIRNVLLTSGTLSPMDSFATELTLPFPIRLENDHVIHRNQALVRCVPMGPTGTPLDSSYKCRDNPKYLMDLGHAVIRFLKIVPGGVLMFFPSYGVLQRCLDFWKSNKQGGTSLWDKILHVKAAMIEPQNPALFPAKIREYKTQIKAPGNRGCILFAVCRGKVSEGIDFSDDEGRAVILAGIPYAQLTDPKVKLKREFLNQQKFGGLTGSKWYCQTAIRAVNQALGRVIRHKNDFGAILLCDRRFCEDNIQCMLSKWIKKSCHQDRSFGTLLGTLVDFFKLDRTRMKAEEQGTAVDIEASIEERAVITAAFKRSAPMKEEHADPISAKKQRKRSISPSPSGQAHPCKETVHPHKEQDVVTESKYSSSPKEFYRQIKEELDERVYRQVQSLLSLLKTHKDVHSFEESLISLLGKDEAFLPLLSHFVVFLPEARRAIFLNKIKTKCSSNKTKTGHPQEEPQEVPCTLLDQQGHSSLSPSPKTEKNEKH